MSTSIQRSESSISALRLGSPSPIITVSVTPGGGARATRLSRLRRRIRLTVLQLGWRAELDERQLLALAPQLGAAVAVADAGSCGDLLERDLLPRRGEHAHLVQVGVEPDHQALPRQLASEGVP